MGCAGYDMGNEDTIDRNILNGQQGHWQRMFARYTKMFGNEPSYAALKACKLFQARGMRKILELGGGQGRDTIFFAQQGFEVCVLDYSNEGLDEIIKEAAAHDVSSLIETICHDVRQPLPFDNDTFDACYSHMLYCMALTFPELEQLSGEVRRVLKEDGLNIYTVRTTKDPHFRTGTDRGDNMWEIPGGFVVHFFDRETVNRLAKGYEIIDVEEFDETRLPKKLYLVTLKKCDI
jgi:SAM-dependent methyltransferase